MKVEEMVKLYSIRLNGEDGIAAYPSKNATKAEIDAIKAAKPEIVAYLKERNRIEQEREARIDSIPGIGAMREYRRAMEAWEQRRELAIEREDYAALAAEPEKPEGYPEAEAYLALENMSFASNCAKAEAGRKGVEAVKDGADPVQSLEDARAEWAAHCESHKWD